MAGSLLAYSSQLIVVFCSIAIVVIVCVRFGSTAAKTGLFAAVLAIALLFVASSAASASGVFAANVLYYVAVAPFVEEITKFSVARRYGNNFLGTAIVFASVELLVHSFDAGGTVLALVILHAREISEVNHINGVLLAIIFFVRRAPAFAMHLLCGILQIKLPRWGLISSIILHIIFNAQVYWILT